MRSRVRGVGGVDVVWARAVVLGWSKNFWGVGHAAWRLSVVLSVRLGAVWVMLPGVVSSWRSYWSGWDRRSKPTVGVSVRIEGARRRIPLRVFVRF